MHPNRHPAIRVFLGLIFVGLPVAAWACLLYLLVE